MPLRARGLGGKEIDAELADCKGVSEVRSCIANSPGHNPADVKLLRGDIVLDDCYDIAAIGLDSDVVIDILVSRVLTVRVYLAGFAVFGKGLYDFGPKTTLPVAALPTTEDELRDVLHASFGVPSSEQRLSFVNPQNNDRYDRFQSHLPNLVVELKAAGRVNFTAGLPSGDEVKLWVTPFATVAQVRDQLLQGPPKHHNPRPPPTPIVADDAALIVLDGVQLADDERLCDRGLSEGGRIEIVNHSLQ